MGKGGGKVKGESYCGIILNAKCGMSIAEFKCAQGVMLSLSKHGGRGEAPLSEPLIRGIFLITLMLFIILCAGL